MKENIQKWFSFENQSVHLGYLSNFIVNNKQVTSRENMNMCVNDVKVLLTFQSYKVRWTSYQNARLYALQTIDVKKI